MLGRLVVGVKREGSTGVVATASVVELFLVSMVHSVVLDDVDAERPEGHSKLLGQDQDHLLRRKVVAKLSIRSNLWDQQFRGTPVQPALTESDESLAASMSLRQPELVLASCEVVLPL